MQLMSVARLGRVVTVGVTVEGSRWRREYAIFNADVPEPNVVVCWGLDTWMELEQWSFGHISLSIMQGPKCRLIFLNYAKM